MQYDEYARITAEAAAAHEAGRTSEAVAVFRELADNPSLPGLDRAMMAMDIAIALTSAGAPLSLLAANR